MSVSVSGSDSVSEPAAAAVALTVAANGSDSVSETD